MRRVLSWLDEEGFNPMEIQDVIAEMNLMIPLGDGDGINVIFRKNKKDSVLIGTDVEFSSTDKKAFSALRGGPKQAYLEELNRSFLMMNLVYGIVPDEDHMEKIHFEKKIFFDGLTKDHLFDTMFTIFRAIRIARWYYSKYLYKGSNGKLTSFFF